MTKELRNVPDNQAAAVWEPIAELQPWSANPRDNKAAIDEVAKSIRRFGWGAPIVANKRNGEIIAGHTRYAAAQKLKLEQVPVRWLDLDPADAHALALADNKVGEVATWDDATLRQVLAELKEADESLLADTGFSDEELARLLGDVEPTVLEPEGEPPEVDEAGPAHSVPGEVYQLGPHRLMCGDSTSVDAVERLMQGEKADMVFTDPPYGVSYTDSLGRSIKNDELTDGDLQDFLRDAFACGVTVTTEDAPWYVWHASRYQREFENALNACSIDVKQQIIWVKGEGVDGTAQVRAPAIGRSDFRWLHEPCFYASRGNPFNAGDRKTTTVWTVTRPTTGTEHPTQKPVPLIEIALENSAKKSATILDLFGGSGSTLMACEKTGRKARLMELDPRYCDVIRRRWTRWAKANNVEAGSGALDG